MIDANDLMLGNYVNTIDGISKVVSLRLDYNPICINKRYVGGESYSDLEPIPISEDWLTKLGFEKQVMSYSKNIDFFGGGRRLSFSGDYLYIIDSEKQNTIPTDIVVLWNKDVMKEFSIHKLQNIYYLLTGEKLTIKQ